ncbi:MAG: Galactose/methyl galactoside import ATP-binding protein MglA [Firmicutes bacterium]|nr:Galactose/methyl galactoside import ATP-binding protein MglA [Bacillota bacterium]
MGVVVQMENIQKEFPGIVACDNISLELRQGEIHALLGENGAGKSTLMSVLFGLYQPDGGSIRVRGNEVRISDPNAANRLGIGVVHQHFKLVSCFTVTENIILGLEPTRGMFVDTRFAAERIKELSDRYGLKVDPHALISDISVGMQQRVEILKMLYRNADILIFDEPTAVLTPQEVQELTKIMSNLAAEGKSIFLITHKLREIKAMAQRCTVIRRGQLIGTVDVTETSEETLAAMMVGRAVSFGVNKAPAKLGDAVLELDRIAVRGRGGVARVKDISFSVRRGEILGLAGVDGNGQAELVEALVGLRRVDGGRILINGKDAVSLSVRERIAAGLAFIPDDRHKYGLILDFSLEENMILKSFHRQPFAKQGLLNFPAIKQHAQKV